MDNFDILANLPWYWTALIAYLLVINLITFFVYGLDKWKASLNTRRIPEKTLWLMAIIGGSVGALGGMKMFHHKTRKAAFFGPFLIILLLQVAVLFILIDRVSN
jgi:uncharacterized membrane protein YsdA (DUF1294 family)